jgi:hypothetical protein
LHRSFGIPKGGPAPISSQLKKAFNNAKKNPDGFALIGDTCNAGGNSGSMGNKGNTGNSGTGGTPGTLAAQETPAELETPATRRPTLATKEGGLQVYVPPAWLAGRRTRTRAMNMGGSTTLVDFLHEWHCVAVLDPSGGD